MAEALKFNPDNPEREKTRRELLERARKLLDWSEEIPEERVPNRNTEFQKYKIRTAWFSNVLVYASLARDANLLSETTRDRYDEILKKFGNAEFGIRDHSRGDIDETNQYLIQVISELEE